MPPYFCKLTYSLNLLFPKLRDTIPEFYPNHRVIGVALPATAGILEVHDSSAFAQNLDVSCRIRQPDDANEITYSKRSARDIGSNRVRRFHSSLDDLLRI